MTCSFPIGIPQQDNDATLPHTSPPELLIHADIRAGRSRAAATLEDLDWYVVDVLPPRLLRALAGLLTPEGGVRRLAVVVDVRSREFSELTVTLISCAEGGLAYRILFLDCIDEELVGATSLYVVRILSRVMAAFSMAFTGGCSSSTCSRADILIDTSLCPCMTSRARSAPHR